uniref:Putative effector protein n=1 Tax=Heterodera avenae TaxID=34510 RepID=A0A2L0VDH9_HETAV|nr:putative effector protein [Heterodera avenae]
MMVLIRLLLLLFLLHQMSFVSALLKADKEAGSEGKFQVLRIVPETPDELTLLRTLYKVAQEFELDFWKAPTNVGAFVDVMVAPEFVNSLGELLAKQHIQYNTIIEDVQSMILQREKASGGRHHQQHAQKGNLSESLLLNQFKLFGKRMRDDASSPVSRNKAVYGFGDYHSYIEMLRWLDDIERFYPQLAQTFTIGTTYEGRPIRGIKIGSPISDTNKRIVWIDGGMHAREWASIHTALWFIDQLISQYGVDPQVTAYMDTLNFYIVPLANPDGFEYSRSDVNPQTRFWRKNRGQQLCKKDRWRRERCCGGVDLNRNFDFHWGETGSSSDLCSDIYQGAYAFSEPESRAIRDKIMSPELYGKVDSFLTLHTYSQMWIHPYNHERRSFPNDIEDLQEVGRRGVRALEQVYGTRYRFGTGADILYPSAGGSDDWAKSKAGVKYVYLLELRPGEEEWDGFLLDRRQLIPTGRETWEGVKVVIDAVMRRAKELQPWRSPTPTTAPTTTTTTTTTIMTTPMVTRIMTTPRPTALVVTPPAAPPRAVLPDLPAQTNARLQNFGPSPSELQQMNRRVDSSTDNDGQSASTLRQAKKHRGRGSGKAHNANGHFTCVWHGYVKAKWQQSANLSATCK